MAKDGNKKPKRKTVFAVIAGMLIVTVFFGCGANRVIEDPALTGTWLYGEKAEYSFQSNGKGNIKLEHDSYTFTYEVNDGILMIDYTDEALSDARYQYSVESGTLTLIGLEGTSGGTYTLNKIQ